MSYEYADQRAQIFTDRGQQEFLKVRDHVQRLLASSGAVRMQEAAFAVPGVSGDTWKLCSYVDRMVELGEIREVTGHDAPGQHRVFVKARE
jgi:hypothetical protein